MPVAMSGGPSRVFMTTDTVGGVWSYALELARGLSRRGIATDLAILGPAPASAIARAQLIEGVRAFATGLPLDWTAQSDDEIDRATADLVRLAEKQRPDLIHLNAPTFAATPAYPAPTVVVAHSCVATWWQAVRGGPLPADFAWRTELMARGLREADAIIAPSRSFAAALGETYGTQLAIAAVRNGCARMTPRRLERKRCCVLTAGRLWDDGKNVAALDRAAARLDVPFFAAGPLTGPNRVTIQFAHLQHVGELDERSLTAWYDRSAIFASAAKYEPFGLTVLEAASSGAALVLSDIATFRELWDDAAVFVQDDDEFAATLRALLDSNSRLADLSHKARKRAGTFTAEQMVEQTLAVYRSVLTRTRSAA
jgi:glycosyltransferase involved in cell wall biosynthesis